MTAVSLHTSYGNYRNEGDTIAVYRTPVRCGRGGITMTTSCIIYIIYVAASFSVGAGFGFCWREIIRMGSD
jgi:hypothetical protein